ncbi:DUF4335 domain-containing protein [Microcoleus sp. FACHB-68]|uniref:DUF4335 domain-containing protein n=1 Tax=Microcoleus sp. FACHB-68 TaxID=2692826 RepID=UPI0016875ADB|nr:DUF4335 domain-containing protein [Microcoleus sp. FACHB-68]MBD1936141.1 DUF4335 domain-containing protein [Microcoleus sp. FACHB-68]
MVLQRYTPPTCTLVIMANGSPLSRWAGRPVLKDLRFELSFDAPQLPEEQRVTVWGDRTQLEALCDAVTTYVQDLLHQSPAQIESAGLTKWSKSDIDSELSRSEEIPDPVRGNRPDLENRRSFGETNFTLHPAAAPAARPQADLNRVDSRNPSRKPALVPPANAVQMTNRPPGAGTGIYLQPKGLLSHNLFLGSLATEESGPVVHLGVLQLFDLASALDEYTTEMVALPSLKRTGSSGILSLLKEPPAWMNTAAVVLLTVGLTAAVGKFLEPQSPAPVQTATSKVENRGSAPPAETSRAKSQQIAIAPPPPPPAASPPAKQQLPAQKLPSLPPGAMATPNSLPAGSSAIPTVPVPKTAPNAASQLEIPADPIPSNPAIPAKPSQSIPEIPPGASNSAPLPLLSPRPATPGAPTSGAPNIDLRARTPAPTPETANQQPAPALSTPPVAPPVAPTPAIAPAPRGAEPPPALPSVTLPDQPLADETPAPQASASGASEPEASATAQPAEVARGTTADTSKIIPQVEEARTYFQQRWTPQEGLTQPLEYTLSLNADGSIQQITPRGLTAGRFLDRTGMPLQNEPFVSPVGGEQAPRIRVVLRPDGQVLTFMEPYKEGF